MTENTEEMIDGMVEAQESIPLQELAPEPIEITYDYPVLCSGPGPHDPPDGICAHSEFPSEADYRCGAEACQKVAEQPVVSVEEQIASLVQQIEVLKQAVLDR